jgi:lysocardiolipin and lysophospholipid acyltransferase
MPRAEVEVPHKVSARGVVIVSVMFVTSLVGSVVLMSPSLLLLPLPFDFARRLYRRWNAAVVSRWLALSALMLETSWLGGVTLVLTGDVMPLAGDAPERALVIANHRTRVDWMFHWCLLARLGQLGALKVMLKEALRKAPGFGWAMQGAGYVFLSRRARDADLAHIRASLRHAAAYSPRVALLLFPEGTDLSPSNVELSHEFARAHKLKAYEQVLHPKVAGLATALEALRGEVDVVYDVTMGYVEASPGERPSEWSLLSGRLPSEVHVHLERRPLAPLALDGEKDVGRWLRGLWERKEALLERFDKAHKFAIASPGGSAALAMLRRRRDVAYCTAALFWLAALALTAAGLARSAAVRWWLGAALAAHVVVTAKLGGLDKLELDLSRGAVARALARKHAARERALKED